MKRAEAKRRVVEFLARGLEEDLDGTGVVGPGWEFTWTKATRAAGQELLAALKARAKAMRRG